MCYSSIGFSEEVLERSVFKFVSLPANKVEFRSRPISAFVHIFAHIIRPKKIPVVPVSYREKIRVCRSEIISFQYFFHGFGGFLLGNLQ